MTGESKFRGVIGDYDTVLVGTVLFYHSSALFAYLKDLWYVCVCVCVRARAHECVRTCV